MDEQKREEKRRFTPDEVGELVELAGRLDDDSRDLSLDNVKQVALEMGVGEEALRRAIAEKDALAQAEKAKAAAAQASALESTKKPSKLRRLRTEMPGLIVAAFSVVVIDFATTGGFTWSRWPLMGISIAIVVQLAGLMKPDDE